MWKPLKTPHGCSLCMWECNQNFRCEFTWIPFLSKFIVLVLYFKMHQIFQRKREENCTLNQQNRANNNNILKALWQCCIKKSVFTFQHAIWYCNRPKKCILTLLPPFHFVDNSLRSAFYFNYNSEKLTHFCIKFSNFLIKLQGFN